MVRLTLQTRLVLRVLVAADAPQYGLQLADSCGLRSGSIHPILARLESAGWVRSQWEEIDESEAKRRRRRFYVLTPQGIREAAAIEHEDRSRKGWTIHPVSR